MMRERALLVVRVEQRWSLAGAQESFFLCFLTMTNGVACNS